MRAGEFHTFFACNLRYGAFGCEVALQYLDVGAGLDGLVERSDEVLSARSAAFGHHRLDAVDEAERPNRRQVLCQRLASHCQHVAVQEPSSNRYFITAGTPPMECRSVMTYLPLGLRSAMRGVRSLIRWKSASVNSKPSE